jgi:hypothetical protein
MRLALVPLLLLSIGGMFLLGREISGRLAVGVIAAVLMLFAGAPDPLPGTHGLFFRNLSHSDTFLLGLALFLPLLAELTVKLRRASAGEEEPNPTGTWAVILLLLAGCAGAKGPTLPVLIGGLVISLAFALWRDHVSVPPLRTTLIMAGALLLAALAFIYGSSGGAIKVFAFGPGRLTEQYVDFVRTLPGWVPEEPTLAFFGGIVANSKMLAPLVPGLGVLLLTWRSQPPQPAALVVLLAGISITAVACFNMLSAVGEAQNYFLFYGYASLGVLSGLGLYRVRLLDRSPPGAVAAAAGLCAVVFALAAVSDRPFSTELHLRKYGGGAATLAPDIEAGLDWIRRNTPTDAVLAVNNQYDDRDHRRARDCVYPAFTERRVMLSCDYGSGAVYPALGDLRNGEEKHPYPERFALNEAIFRGDPVALRRAMAKYGVDYLVVDRLHALGDMPLAPIEQLGRTVYANRHLLVIQPYR